MLADALRRLLARLTASDPGRPRGSATGHPPELLEIERRAVVAMTACTCGHAWHLHEHAHARTGCDGCGCQRFRPAERPPPVAVPEPRPADAVLIRLRVALWTRAWRDGRGAPPR